MTIDVDYDRNDSTSATQIRDVVWQNGARDSMAQAGAISRRWNRNRLTSWAGAFADGLSLLARPSRGRPDQKNSRKHVHGSMLQEKANRDEYD